MATVVEKRIALNDLIRTFAMSCVNADGSITAYEYKGTAQIIVHAVNALAEIREAEVDEND